jgi:hypothetical protein
VVYTKPLDTLDSTILFICFKSLSGWVLVGQARFQVSLGKKFMRPHLNRKSWAYYNNYFFFPELGLELRAYTLSHFTSPFL